jgi:glycosyltransferase involved in cell wall biosynthesis
VLLKVLSFSRQYPAALFPGESDRASDTQSPLDLDIDSRIDSINPGSWILAARTIHRFRPDVVLAPGWTFFLAPCFAFILASLRRRGIKVIALVHNPADHDATPLRAWLTLLQLRQADAYITHTQELARRLTTLIPGARVRVHPHPVFDYPQAKGLLPKRDELELLMFGIVRTYKGLDVLLEALSRVKSQTVRLTVVGEVWKEVGDVRLRIQELGIEGKVELVQRYVTDAEAAEFFERADAVVLPYRSVTGSGVLPLAFYYGKPVAVSDLPGLSELVDEGTGWVLPVGDAHAWAHAIDHLISRDAAAEMQSTIHRARQHLTFDAFAETLLELTRAIPAPKV